MSSIEIEPMTWSISGDVPPFKGPVKDLHKKSPYEMYYNCTMYPSFLKDEANICFNS